MLISQPWISWWWLTNVDNHPCKLMIVTKISRNACGWYWIKMVSQWIKHMDTFILSWFLVGFPIPCTNEWISLNVQIWDCSTSWRHDHLSSSYGQPSFCNRCLTDMNQYYATIANHHLFMINHHEASVQTAHDGVFEAWNCLVRFPRATCDRRIRNRTVGLDDGFTQIILMFAIIGFAREFEIDMKDDGNLRRVLESFRSIRCSFTFFDNPGHHFLQSLSFLACKIVFEQHKADNKQEFT